MSVTTKLNGIREILAFDNRWQLLADRLFFRKTSLTIYKKGTLEFIVDVAGGDVNGVRSAVASGMYRDMLPPELWSSDISVLDVGANAGGFPLMLASVGISIKQLVCVEMNPNTFQRLQFNTAHNFGPGVVCVNAAVCGRPGTLDLLLGKGSTSDSIYEEKDSTKDYGASRFSIRGLTIDAVCEQAFSGAHIDLCKIDVEGAEYEIFSNPGHDYLKKCRRLIMEIHNRKDENITAALLDSIGKLGFVQTGLSDADDVFLFENRTDKSNQPTT